MVRVRGLTEREERELWLSQRSSSVAFSTAGQPTRHAARELGECSWLEEARAPARSPRRAGGAGEGSSITHAQRGPYRGRRPHAASSAQRRELGRALGGAADDPAGGGSRAARTQGARLRARPQ